MNNLGIIREAVIKPRSKDLERNYRWKRLNKDKVSAQGKKYYLKNKESINIKNLAYSRGGGNLKRYNITLDDYQKILLSQNSVCAICKGPEVLKLNGVVRKLAVDHDHKTGGVRGLLCSGCNRGIGYLKDNADVLESALNYLKKWKTI